MRKVRFAAILLITSMLLTINTAMAYSMPYYIDVDLSNNIVTVYSSEDDSIVRQMICSSGTPGTPSPTGTFFMPEKYKSMERTEWYTFQDGYGKYGSRIWGNYLFHSYLFYEPDESTLKSETYAALGSSASHGCIRLYIEDAKWIAENCMPGTKVKLFYNTERMDYVKELVYIKTYSIDSGITYDQFISRAVSPSDMGYSSEGEDVSQLQLRLNELGLYDGKADGFYGPQMVSTIKNLQKLLGHDITGIVDTELLSIINSDDCPTALICTLSEGMSSTSVTELQRILISIGLYEVAPSGIYDEATKEAVIKYQIMTDRNPDGVATPEIQQDMLSLAYQLSNEYGDYGAKLVYDAQLRTIARINVDKRLNVRAKDGSVIDSLENGTVVDFLYTDGDWSYIRYKGNKEGYVSTAYLIIEEEIIYVPRYAPADNYNEALPVISIGNLAETVVNSYGTISIKERLHFRVEPTLESDLAFVLSPGTRCRILSETDNGWLYVQYGEKTGYAMSKYFDITHITELTGEYIQIK